MEIRNLLKGTCGISRQRRWEIDEKIISEVINTENNTTDVTGARG